MGLITLPCKTFNSLRKQEIIYNLATLRAVQEKIPMWGEGTDGDELLSKTTTESDTKTHQFLFCCFH